MLTVNDRLRLRANNLEFMLPFWAQRPLNLLRESNPYLPEDDKFQAIFIHVPKAAGTSLRRALYQRKSFHIPAVRYRAFDSVRFERYFKFCFVRNPWSRLLSAFNYLHSRCDSDAVYRDHRWAATYLREYRDFETFVMELENPTTRRSIRRYLHFRNQLDWISEPGTPRKLLMDYVGRYETLDADYAHIVGRLGLLEELAVERKGSYVKDYRRAYSPSMVDIAARIYHADIDAFGYTFE